MMHDRTEVYVLSFVDVKRAHWNAKANRTIYVELPPEAVQGMEQTRKLLTARRPVLDLTEAAEEFIVMIMNGKVLRTADDDRPLIHYHFNGCQCGGRAVFSGNCRKAYLLLAGAGCPLCLLYRWFGF